MNTGAGPRSFLASNFSAAAIFQDGLVFQFFAVGQKSDESKVVYFATSLPGDLSSAIFLFPGVPEFLTNLGRIRSASS
jgi:hypothetical protein